MNVFFEEDLLNHYPRSGITVYQYELMRHLSEMPDIRLCTGQVTLNPRNFSRTGRVLKTLPSFPERRLVPVPGRLARQKWLGRFIAGRLEKNMDVIHLVDGIIPAWLNRRSRPPLVVTIHDAVMLRFPDRGTMAVGRDLAIRRICKAVEMADHIITVSNFSKRELIDCLDTASRKKITAIPIAAQFSQPEIQKIQAELPRAAIADGHPFFLAVSVVSPRKNYKTLLAAWKIFREKHPDFRLVIVGRLGWNSDDIWQQIHSVQGVISFEAVSRAELIQLYSAAYGYFNLSYYEGFGIPLLEAMMCRCPCCYADGSAMNEVAGPFGLPVPPFDQDAVIAAMEQFSCGRLPMPDGFSQWIEEFSWSKNARKTFSVYQSLMS